MGFKIDIEGRNGMHLLPMFSMLGAFYIGLIIVKKKRGGIGFQMPPVNLFLQSCPPTVLHFLLCSTMHKPLKNQMNASDCTREIWPTFLDVASVTGYIFYKELYECNSCGF